VGRYNDTKTQNVRETRTGTHEARRYNTPLNCITLSSCTTKHPPHGRYRGACGRSENDRGGGERWRRRRDVGRRQRPIHGSLLLKLWLRSRLSHVYGIYVIVNELRFPCCFDLIEFRMEGKQVEGPAPNKHPGCASDGCRHGCS